MFYRLKSADFEVDLFADSIELAVKSVFTSSDPAQRIFISHLSAYEYMWNPSLGEPETYSFLCDIEVLS